MAVNVTLGALYAELRAELNRSANAASSAGEKHTLTRALRRTQNHYYLDFKGWPHLQNPVYLRMAQGQRYYDFPEPNDADTDFDNANAGIDADTITAVWLKEEGANDYHRIKRNIGVCQFASYDSNEGERCSPVERFDVRSAADGRFQLEVWPIPDTGTDKLVIDAMRPLRQLTSDNHRCDIDDELLILATAAQVLVKKDKETSATLAGLASTRYATLKGAAKAAIGSVVMGGSHSETRGYTGPRPLYGKRGS